MRVYSVPRRFGLATLLVVTVAVGILSAIFRWLQLPAEAALIVLFFIGFVSTAQFLFNRAPRLASMLAGAIFFVLFAVAMQFIADSPPSIRSDNELIEAIVGCSLWGGLWGYLTGVAIGSLFMLIAGARAIFTKHTNDQSRA
ncbi:MAG TPA: hypothetical protein VGI40_16725 [Pirellulaceae bacterium]|jgi:hypothetical protein